MWERNCLPGVGTEEPRYSRWLSDHSITLPEMRCCVGCPTLVTLLGLAGIAKNGSRGLLEFASLEDGPKAGILDSQESSTYVGCPTDN